MPADLSYVHLKNNPKHRHRWIMVANYTVTDKLLATMAEGRLAAQYAHDQGKDYEGESIQIPMGQDQLIGVDGPGCQKCGAHWQQPLDEQTGFGGWGTPCPVSDDVFAEAGEPVKTPEPQEDVTAPATTLTLAK